ncbi:hypothetical protein TRSC58_02627 [Trypanosoma rangeli SC58]|uniref:Pre-mRNA-splicing factor 38 C-terminal domain-containing protein n=1 Tax=Trypanosoma rangeli SC58 TaxID=429131 RepID=A0A061J5Q0_TRYRA|nr:hypothetical protein TRSC58_02627 [Trypanosoma rangeli SC58]
MVEPHLFSGPEFVLEVPAEHPQPLQPSVLLQLQTELYGLLTPTVRRKLQATFGGNSSSGAVPPPPDRLLFIDIAATPPADAAGDERCVQVVLLVTDSRAAAELFSIGLKNPFIALPHRMRLRNQYAVSGGKARGTPAEILRKKEALRSRMNFDEDLWETLQKALTPEWLQEFESRYCQLPAGDVVADVTPMRDTERHERRVEGLLRYCEREVQYVGVMDEKGNASPFLVAMGVFYRYGLTYRDALIHFARHPRRPTRALALFIARYTAAPEELEPFFAPSLTDEVTIACAEDANVTTTMRQLCEDLLLCDEVWEAWPPTYQAYWVEHKVRPMMHRIEAECKRCEELRQARAGDGGRATAVMTRTPPGKAPGEKTDTKVRGSGKGVGVFGFRNLTELQTYVQERERVLVPQRIFFMAAAPPEGGVDNVYGDGNDDAADDVDDDDFLIKVRVGSSSSGGGVKDTACPPPQALQEAQQQPRGVERRKRERELAVTTNTRALVVTGAYRTVLRLLGRTEPFDRRGEHYLEF